MFIKVFNKLFNCILAQSKNQFGYLSIDKPKMLMNESESSIVRTFVPEKPERILIEFEINSNTRVELFLDYSFIYIYDSPKITLVKMFKSKDKKESKTCKIYKNVDIYLYIIMSDVSLFTLNIKTTPCCLEINDNSKFVNDPTIFLSKYKNQNLKNWARNLKIFSKGSFLIYLIKDKKKLFAKISKKSRVEKIEYISMDNTLVTFREQENYNLFLSIGKAKKIVLSFEEYILDFTNL